MPSQWQKRQFVEHVHSGGLVAYPTESVYGLGCHPANQQAILSLLRLKNRTWQKGLILIGSSIEQFELFLEPLSQVILDKVTAEYEEPTTWLLPASDNASPLLTGLHQTIAVRLVKHGLAQELCALSDTALVSTSANKSGCAPFTTAWQTRLTFARERVLTISGRVGESKTTSRLIDPVNNKQYR